MNQYEAGSMRGLPITWTRFDGDLPQTSKAHYYDADGKRTLCGLPVPARGEVLEEAEPKSHRTCKRCLKAAEENKGSLEG